MQIVVKKLRMRLDGEITSKLIAYLAQEFGEVGVSSDPEDELVEVTASCTD